MKFTNYHLKTLHGVKFVPVTITFINYSVWNVIFFIWEKTTIVLSNYKKLVSGNLFVKHNNIKKGKCKTIVMKLFTEDWNFRILMLYISLKRFCFAIFSTRTSLSTNILLTRWLGRWHRVPWRTSRVAWVVCMTRWACQRLLSEERKNYREEKQPAPCVGEMPTGRKAKCTALHCCNCAATFFNRYFIKRSEL